MAEKMDISDMFYFDIEMHHYELYIAINQLDVKKLCAILNLDIFDLLEIQCPFCENKIQYDNRFLQDRNIFIKKSREKQNLTIAQLSEKHDLSIEDIVRVENDPLAIEFGSIGFIKEFALALDIPLQMLLATKCKKCGH